MSSVDETPYEEQEGDGGHTHKAHADAETLTAAHEIRSDGPRHKKALAALQYRAEQAGGAAEHEGAKAAFHKRVKGGMAKAFGKQGKAPFAKAGENQPTPFDEAAQGE